LPSRLELLFSFKNIFTVYLRTYDAFGKEKSSSTTAKPLPIAEKVFKRRIFDS